MRLKPDPCVEARFESEPEPLLTSVVCLEEIRYGAKIGPSGNRLWERFAIDLRPHLNVLPLDESVGVLKGTKKPAFFPTYPATAAAHPKSLADAAGSPEYTSPPAPPPPPRSKPADGQ